LAKAPIAGGAVDRDHLWVQAHSLA
jgi:hypothetical protein